MNYPESVQYLYALGNEMRGAKLGLDRITALAAALNSPERAPRIVHVAGTNGKGSTCAMIESALRASGLKTGLFTSPHLVAPTERIQIGGVAVTDAEFARAFEGVHAAAERMMESGAIDAHPSYFETVTLMAFLLFRDHGVDTAVIEVGLGGRLDATNIVNPALTVIAPVDFDHEAWLGKSLQAIAFEKAGILKHGVPAVYAQQRAEADIVIRRRASEVAAPVIALPETTILEADAYGSVVRTGAMTIRCPLPGEHQVENLRTAVAALRWLGAADGAIERGIAATRWPGRLERVRSNPDLFLDGAHNPAGARALARYIERFHAAKRVAIIFGAMRDKAVEEVTGLLFPLAADVILTAPGQPRAVRPEALQAMTDHPNVRVAESLAEAIEMASGADVAFVTGSLYLVGEARALLVQ